MCGRFSFAVKDKAELKKRFRLKRVGSELVPRYNIAPSQQVPVILNKEPEDLSAARWGLLPHWAKEQQTKYNLINARLETVAEKPAYRGLIKDRRCLILADGFYEWAKTSQGKQPFRFVMVEEKPFAMAGLWDIWEKGETKILSCVIITTGANAVIRDIHDRMPVVLSEEEEGLWLKGAPFQDLAPKLAQRQEEGWSRYEIAKTISSPSHEGPELIRPLGRDQGEDKETS